MPQPVSLALEPVKRIGLAQEADLLRQALTRRPDSRIMRLRYAAYANQSDDFAETISLLGGVADLDADESLLLVQALLARETVADTVRAAAVARQAAAAAPTERVRAQALADLGKAQLRLDDSAAEDTLRLALQLDPLNKDACKRLTALLMARDQPGDVVKLCTALSAHGAAHSRFFAAWILALARVGDVEAARALDGDAVLSCEGHLAVPAGWASLDAFNDAVAAELLGHRALRFERYGTASELTWRIDNPATADAPVVGQLLQLLRDRVAAYIDRVSTIDHPWVKARPAVAMLHSWCVITDSIGYETWHVHQFGWLSGVYYVQIPEAISSGTGMGGCLGLGLPDDVVGADAAARFGFRLVRPRAGMMRFFPSHVYHRTFAHALPERRICLAFDIRPR